MLPNYSPWIKQLNRTRGVVSLDTDLKTDVAIVGGGIAGITTAYFTLKNTDKNVVLIEADKIAHGATGHNAGQIVAAFERPLAEIVQEFGLQMAIEGQKAIESACGLLDETCNDTQLNCPIYKFTGYVGLSTPGEVRVILEDKKYKLEGGLVEEQLIIAEEWEGRKEINGEYEKLYSVVPHKDLLSLLETKNQEYIACLASPRGCMNSALFSEELLSYMKNTYADRFSFYENSPVKAIVLYENKGILEILGHTIIAEKVVLCTNGFEKFSIQNTVGQEVNTNFHHLVTGYVGYMSGYIEPLNNPPVAIAYFGKERKLSDNPIEEEYFYMTRRPYEDIEKKSHNLVCAGGPEQFLPEGADYSKEHESRDDIRVEIAEFLKENYKQYPKDNAEHAFFWHGLMGYTPNGIRRIGVEPLNPVLLYNLGCNGIGILPSIYGGKRLSQILAGEKLEKSIF